MKKKLFFAATVAFITAILINVFTQPGLNDFETTFTEVAKVRNDNNTGPVQRVYIVTVDQINQDEMERYGQLMPYSKLGNTKVFFFDQSKPFPEVAQLGDLNFDSTFNELCLAKYEKRFGSEGLFPNPFK